MHIYIYTYMYVYPYQKHQFWSFFPLGLTAEVLEKAPGFAEAWHKRSIAYFAQKNFKEAVEDCRKVHCWGGKIGNSWKEEPRK